MKRRALGQLGVLSALALVALVHCGSDDEPTPIECSLGADGKSCDCTPGRESLGFCSPHILGVPSICCADDAWPGSGTRCNCDLVVCVSAPESCKCTRSTQRLTGPSGLTTEVAECPLKTGDATRCCIDKAGNCGCYPKSADQCGEGATDVDKCDYSKVTITCGAGTRSISACDDSGAT